MPPVSPSLTQRLFIHYTSALKNHQVEVRPSGVQTAATLAAMAASFAVLIADYMIDYDSFTSAEYCGVGSNVRFPLPFTAVAGSNSVAGNVYADDPESIQLSMTGKGIFAGVKWSHRLFTPFNFGGSAWPPKNRWDLPSAPLQVQNYWSRIQQMYDVTGLAGVQLVTAGSQPPIINNWVNICHNGYWTRIQRR